ncbi:MAG: PIN domain-containing protein [Acidobacteria bacterium]|nr:PIN domain-containing protein [Acidobacteriota bacterium]
MVSLVDTNVLVYRFDSRFPEKQRIATEVLRQGLLTDSLRIPHQCIIEFVAVVSRPVRGHLILGMSEGLRQANRILSQFTILYPTEALVRIAIECCTRHQLNWFDAQILAYALHYDVKEIITEDFTHDRVYGGVRTVNPFPAARE